MDAPATNSFVIQRNIQRYRELLKVETSETRRRVILELLADEERKLGEFQKSQGS
jgi:hypothetical protein